MQVLNQRYLAVLLALLLGGASTAVFAGDVAPVFDAELCRPAYPDSSKANNEQGELVLSVLVSVQGVAADVKVAKSTGHRDLDRAGVMAAVRCKFVPGSVDGKVVEGWTEVRYSWKL